MKKNPITFLVAICMIALTAVILLFPAKCLVFSLNGLDLWFKKMIPALFPFMVLSGIMIRMNLTESFSKIMAPVIKPIFQIRNSCIYVMIVGFLCGFPMGAHVISQLYERKQLSYKEAEFLLSFCNNIGPVYFISFALPVIGIKQKASALLGMYGIPFMYGLLLRYTVYAGALPSKENPTRIQGIKVSLPEALDDSVITALNGITKLGGYMIIFNLLNIVPQLIFPKKIAELWGCFLEITGGLQMLGNRIPIFSVVMLSFGGLSCLLQTYSMIKNTDLSIYKYFIHKVSLTIVSFIYYYFLIL